MLSFLNSLHGIPHEVFKGQGVGGLEVLKSVPSTSTKKKKKKKNLVK
jgi:hypothetical protein